jgi:SAM-dependent methyltransferase
MEDALFEQRLQEAEQVTLSGWDFSWLDARTQGAPLPWNYRDIVTERMRQSRAMVDLATGGGEFLASLAPFPPITWATEGYPPNIILARQRLEPLGIQVADVSEPGGKLPFEDAYFDLVIDRHEGVLWNEVYRILKPGGRLVTQQVGGENCSEFNQFFQDQPYFEYSHVNMAQTMDEIEAAGFTIIDAAEDFPTWTFFDVAAVIFYLNAVPWQIEGFSVAAYRDKLFQLHQQIERDGQWIVHQHRFYIEALKETG